MRKIIIRVAGTLAQLWGVWLIVKNMFVHGGINIDVLNVIWGLLLIYTGEHLFRLREWGRNLALFLSGLTLAELAFVAVYVGVLGSNGISYTLTLPGLPATPVDNPWLLGAGWLITVGLQVGQIAFLRQE